MDLSSLKPAKGAVKIRKRIGRGQGSGRGGTSTKGHKGAKSRSGYKFRPGFEGGQMPLQRRLPKFGFKNPFRVAYTALNLDTLQHLADKHKVTEISVDFLREKNVISRTEKVKVLANGELTSKLVVKVHKSSAKAEEAIKNAGGSLELIK
ncbi:MAG: 50S ribosomal protein L15 [Chitinophagaceae bacterium]|jgi:large subunit ribosomal protein L15|nr:MAG: 50S ribosomal protein L15 [Chitinophagaceae bacterium]